jgi:CheY-like chemotaxis protein
MMLTGIGFEVREATNGEEGVAAFSEWLPHATLMDVRMPVMNGIEATREIRATEAGKDTIIIALTGSVFDEQVKEAEEAGIDHLLKKPFREAELMELLAEHLGCEFEYAEEGAGEADGGEAEGGPLSPDALADLPFELVGEMLQATESADMDLLDELLIRVAGHDPNVADSLRQLADAFEYDALTDLFEGVNG